MIDSIYLVTSLAWCFILILDRTGKDLGYREFKRHEARGIH